MAKSADIGLEITPNRVDKKVAMIRHCYQPYDRYVFIALALASNNGVPVCILRSTPSVRAMKWCMQLRWCVVLPPTPTGDA